jgi:D-hydroxyproline dehydrogenase subunit alpha
MLRTEVAVIGAGPAGLAAAVEAFGAGAGVILMDEYLRLGGQFFKQLPSTFKLEQAARLDRDYARGQELMRLVSGGNGEVWLDAQEWGAFDGRTLAVNRDRRSVQLRAEKIIVATGAYDRPVPFPGWTLPGVVTAGAAQTLVKSQGVLPGQRVLLVGTGPFQLPVARQLLHAGATIVAVVEAVSLPTLMRGSLGAAARPGRIPEGLAYWTEIRRAGAPFMFGHTILRAEGDGRVQRAILTAIDDEWRVKPGTERSFDVDAVCLGFGFLPSTQITQLLGCTEQFDPLAGGFLPVHGACMETGVPGVFVAGESAGIGGSDVAMLEGRLAATEALLQLGRIDQAEAGRRRASIRPELERARRFAGYINRTFAVKPAIFERIPDDTVVCRCEEVTAGEIRRAAVEGADTQRSVKIATRAGMGLCQGRICGTVTAQLASLATGMPVERFGYPSARPPIKPVRLSDLAASQP